MQVTPISSHRQQRNPNFIGLNVRVDKMYDRVANKLSKYGIQEDTFSSVLETIGEKTPEKFSLKFTDVAEYFEKKMEVTRTKRVHFCTTTESYVIRKPLENPYLGIDGELSMCEHPVGFSVDIPIKTLQQGSISELENRIMQTIQKQRDWYNKTMQSLLEQ